MNNRFRNLARVLGVVAIVLAASTFTLDKFMPYRIRPADYVLYLWAGRLVVVTFPVVVVALVLGIASRQWLPSTFAIIGFVFLLSVGGPHSGPNPETWCYNNLRKIEAAKERLVEKTNLTNGVAVTSEQISSYIKGGLTSLECAKHGKYSINPIGAEPRCSFHGSTS